MTSARGDQEKIGLLDGQERRDADEAPEPRVTAGRGSGGSDTEAQAAGIPAERTGLPRTATICISLILVGVVTLHVATGGSPSTLLEGGSPVVDDASAVCLLHISFGESYKLIGEKTIPTKKAYAEKHGYRLKVIYQDTYDSIIENEFTECMDGAVTADGGFDKQSLVKFCGLWEAFADGCDTVFYTDADAVIFNKDLPLHHWTSKDRSADVYWSLNDPGPHEWCREQQAKGDVGTLASFASCLNAGALIMRRTAWTWSYLRRLLELSRHTIEQKCSTADQNPGANDQCYFKSLFGHDEKQKSQAHVGDQCVIACDSIQHPDDLQHFAYFGPDERPIFQFVQVGPVQVREAMFWWHPWVTEQAFVVNCAGSAVPHQKEDCVSYMAAQSDKRQS